MKVTVYKCDVCKKERTETNHWFLCRGLSKDNCITLRQDSYIPRIEFLFWSDAMADSDKNLLHLCGEQCLQKMLGEFLSKR